MIGPWLGGSFYQGAHLQHILDYYPDKRNVFGIATHRLFLLTFRHNFFLRGAERDARMSWCRAGSAVPFLHGEHWDRRLLHRFVVDAT